MSTLEFVHRYLVVMNVVKSLIDLLCVTCVVLQCSEEDLKQVFAKFGTVLESKIPLKPGKNNLHS